MKILFFQDIPQTSFCIQHSFLSLSLYWLQQCNNSVSHTMARIASNKRNFLLETVHLSFLAFHIIVSIWNVSKSFWLSASEGLIFCFPKNKIFYFWRRKEMIEYKNTSQSSALQERHKFSFCGFYKCFRLWNFALFYYIFFIIYILLLGLLETRKHFYLQWEM